MTKKLTFFTFILLVTILNFSYAQTLKNVNHTVNKALKILESDIELKNAGVGFYAIDVISGDIIAELNPDLALKPASTMKVVTTATALEVLGADYKFKTQLRYDGKIDTIEKILYGNIYIQGGGDPTLGSKYFVQTRSKQFLDNWAEAIKKLGIDSITGSIIGDATIYTWDIVPPTWSWEDMGNYFGAGACGLSVYDNFYTLFFQTSSVVGRLTTIKKVEPIIPGLTFDNQVVSANTSSDRSYIFGEPYNYSRYIRGSLPKAKKEYKVKGSMPDPCYFTALELDKKLNSIGIKTGKEPTTIRLQTKDGKLLQKSKVFHTYYSQKVSDIVYKTNLHSVNLFAEHLLNHIGVKLQGKGDTKTGAYAIENFWAKKGMSVGGLSINDGCGLSHYNTVTPKQLVFVLTYMKNKSQNFDAFYNSLSISGKKGTLKRVCVGTAAEGKIFAKSGSIRNVRCYTGYTTSYSGREIAFAMMLNNFNCSSTKARQKLEKLMIALVSLTD